MYQALFKLAFDNIVVEFPNGSMQQAIYEITSPMILANIKNQVRGKKGGRPRKNEPEESQELQFNSGINNFIEDYKIFKNKNFEPTNREKEKISIILDELGEYDQSYWQTVFKKAKSGFLINGENVPCSLTKILHEHNAIYRDEANLSKNRELEDERKNKVHQQKQKEDAEYNKIVDKENAEREEAKKQIKNVTDAIEYLNNYLPKGLNIRQVASDHKDLKIIYPSIRLNKQGVFYEEST